MPNDLEYTVKGALMMCDKGAVPAPFSPTTNQTVKISGALVSNEMDVAPIVNIPIFGVCAARGGQPCTPVPVKWMDTYAVKVHGGKTLLYKSYLPCGSGGKIEFLTSGQVPLPPGKMDELIAENSEPEEPEDEGWGWWDTAELIPFVGNVIGMVREAKKGNWGMVALNAAFLVVDIVTAGAGSAITAPLKGGIKAGVKTMAKTAAKTAAKATTKAGAKQLAKAGAKAVAGAIRKQVDEIVEAGGKMLTYACFPAGTLVAGEDGPIAIENVRNGMLVWAKDSETGAKALKRVKDRHSRTIDTTTIIKLADETIETTAEHPFFTEGGWKMAADLQPGDKLCTREGHWHAILTVEFGYEEKTVYNFEVEDFHTYFVGKWEWLVHNASGCKGLKGAGKKAGKSGDDIAGAGKKGKGRNQADRKKCTKEGHPVDVATGKLYTEHIDFTLPGPLPLAWERVWYSTSDHKGPIGHG